jgi:hypothetical protein
MMNPALISEIKISTTNTSYMNLTSFAANVPMEILNNGVPEEAVELNDKEVGAEELLYNVKCLSLIWVAVDLYSVEVPPKKYNPY